MEVFRSYFSSPEDLFNFTAYRVSLRSLKRLQDLFALSNVFGLANVAYATMYERTKRSPTAKLLL